MGYWSRRGPQLEGNIQVRQSCIHPPFSEFTILCRFLTADVRGAKADLLESLTLNPSFTQSLVKLASVHMEEGDNAQAMKCFEDAIKINEDDPDVYYHRGQGVLVPLLVGRN